MYGRFACMYVCATCVYLVPVEARRRWGTGVTVAGTRNRTWVFWCPTPTLLVLGLIPRSQAGLELTRHGQTVFELGLNLPGIRVMNYHTLPSVATALILVSRCFGVFVLIQSHKPTLASILLCN